MTVGVTVHVIVVMTVDVADGVAVGATRTSTTIVLISQVLDPRGDGAEGQDGGEGASEPNGDGKGGLYARSSGNNGDCARGALRGDGGGDGSPFRGRGGAGEALVSGGSSGDFEVRNGRIDCCHGIALESLQGPKSRIWKIGEMG